jgi:hypothetical protein
MISPYGPHHGPPKKKTAPCAAPTPVPCLIPSSTPAPSPHLGAGYRASDSRHRNPTVGASAGLDLARSSSPRLAPLSRRHALHRGRPVTSTCPTAPPHPDSEPSCCAIVGESTTSEIAPPTARRLYGTKEAAEASRLDKREGAGDGGVCRSEEGRSGGNRVGRKKSKIRNNRVGLERAVCGMPWV